MAITLNKVGIEIDGKVYQFYKLTFGFQRKLVEVQSNLNKLTTEIAKKHSIEPEAINESDKVPESDKLEIAKAGLKLQESLGSLFVNQDEIGILDNFDGDSLTELIEALK
jgi:hypothetical protein